MKHSITKTVPFLLLGFSVFFLGCGSNVPKDMPKLYPCSLVITQDGTPLEGANVSLFSTDPAITKWAAGGVTDAAGKVQVQTQGKYPGAAAGEYRVIVSKTSVEKGVIVQEETETTAEKSIPGKTYSFVEARFGDLAQTPLSLKVEGKTLDAPFDVGKAVKEEIFTN